MSDIFKRFKCDFCGKIEYKEYIGTEHFDGGYTTVNSFEPSDFVTLRIGDMSYKICPSCENEIMNYINIYKQKCLEEGKEKRNESV